MAIFKDNRELLTQRRHVGMDKVDGGRKVGLAMTGYNSDGSKNLFGKLGGIGAITGAVGSIFGPAGIMVGKQLGDYASRGIASGLSKGTDTGDVFDETQDEYLHSKLSEAAFLYEGAKAYTTLGLGDLGSSTGVSSTMMGDVAGESVSSSVSAGADVTGVSQGIKAGVESSHVDSGVQTLIDLKNSKATEEIKDTLNKKSDDLIDNKSDKELVDSLTEEEEKEELEKEERMKKLSKGLSKVPLLGGVASSGLNLIAARKNLKNETEKEILNFKNKTAKDAEFNLL